MKLTHDHPDEALLGLRKETYEELQARVVQLTRACELHVAVRTQLLQMLHTPSASMIKTGQIMADMGGDAKEIWDIMATHGLVELYQAGKL